MSIPTYTYIYICYLPEVACTGVMAKAFDLKKRVSGMLSRTEHHTIFQGKCYK